MEQESRKYCRGGWAGGVVGARCGESSDDNCVGTAVVRPVTPAAEGRFTQGVYEDPKSVGRDPRPRRPGPSSSPTVPVSPVPGPPSL